MSPRILLYSPFSKFDTALRGAPAGTLVNSLTTVERQVCYRVLYYVGADIIRPKELR